MDHATTPTPRTTGTLVDRHLTLRDGALIATIPALYVGAFALRLFHLLP